MRIRFWGTRGSIAKPGPSTLRYGGNTSCVEVQASDGTLVVLDCGTGAHGLGRDLVQRGAGGAGHLLIGHTHWDHIQGFPFFEPLFVPGNEWHLYAPGGARDLREALAGQLAYEYSPITLASLNADAHFHNLTEGVFEVGGIRVRTQFLHHPVLSLAYRLSVDGATLVYACDHEPHSLHPVGASPGTEPVHHEDRRHVRFLEGADLVIHDGQYTLEDFPARAGWGHSPLERAVDYALLAGVARLAFTHHDPDRDDAGVDALERLARERVREAGSALEVFAAAEGTEVELSHSRVRAHEPLGLRPSALLTGDPPRLETILIVDDDPDILRLLEAALRAEGFETLTASDGSAALDIARRARPSLVLLDMSLGEPGGLDVCRSLRAERDARLRDVPILILTGRRLKETDVVEAFVAGATDYLTKPVKPTLVRSRVRGWLLRTAPPAAIPEGAAADA